MFNTISCENPDLTDPNENQEQTGNDNKPSGGEGEGETESVKFMTITVERVSATKVVFKGTTRKTAPDIEVGIYWSKVQGSHINDCEKVPTYKITNGSFELTLDDLDADTKYYCYPYLFMNGARELGDEFDFKTAQPRFTLDNVSVDGLTVTFTGYADSDCSVGIYCSTSSPSGYNYSTHHSVDAEDNNYTLTLDKLSSSTTYYYCTYVDKYSNDNPEYGTVKSFTTGNPTITIDNVSVSENQVTFTGNADLDCEGGILYSTKQNITIDDHLGIIDMSNKHERNFSLTTSLPMFSTTYTYCTYYKNRDGIYVYSGIQTFAVGDFPWRTATDLSINGTANCYIVSQPGLYKIKTVKGNSKTTVGATKSSEVLWESLGTDKQPYVGQLLNVTGCNNDYIGLSVTYPFTKGNAVIAAKDVNGKILWSWHIWLTDQPQECSSRALMDRNLGATSLSRYDAEVQGLLYQWGRKDPFLGASSFERYSSDIVQAKSTNVFPAPTKWNKETVDVEFTISNPTTFVTNDDNNNSLHDEIGWQEPKTIYDPCPQGWRVPDGNEDGILMGIYRYDPWNGRLDSGYNLGDVWFPMASHISSGSGELVGENYSYDGSGYYWMATPTDDSYPYVLIVEQDGFRRTAAVNCHGEGLSVRCQKE